MSIDYIFIDYDETLSVIDENTALILTRVLKRIGEVRIVTARHPDRPQGNGDIEDLASLLELRIHYTSGAAKAHYMNGILHYTNAIWIDDNPYSICNNLAG